MDVAAETTTRRHIEGRINSTLADPAFKNKLSRFSALSRVISEMEKEADSYIDLGLPTVADALKGVTYKTIRIQVFQEPAHLAEVLEFISNLQFVLMVDDDFGPSETYSSLSVLASALRKILCPMANDQESDQGAVKPSRKRARKSAQIVGRDA